VRPGQPHSQDAAGDDAWALAVTKFGEGALLNSRPVVRREFDRVVITTSAAGSMVLGAAMIAIPAGVAAMIWLIGRRVPGGAALLIFSLPVAGLICLVGLHILLCRNRITGRAGEPELRLRYGTVLFPKQLVLARQGLSAELWVGEGSDWPADKGMVYLTLRKEGSPASRLRLASAPRREELSAAYDALTELLGGRARDGTVVEIELPRGRRIRTSRTPLGTGAANFRTMKLTRPRPDQAVLKPTLGSRLFFAAFFLFGLGALAFVPWVTNQAFEDGLAAWLAVAVTGIIGPAFTILSLLGLSGRFGQRPVRFDLRQGLLWSAGGGGRSVRIDDVAAVQVCGQHVMGAGDAASFTAFELNLILSDPPGERLGLFSHGAEPALRSDARLLAEFLDKPIVDHT